MGKPCKCYSVPSYKKINPYWTLPLLFFIITAYIGMMKFFFQSTTKFYQTPHKYDYLGYIGIELSTFFSLAFEYQILYNLLKSTCIPAFIVDFVFLVIMILILILTILDLENSRELQNDIGYDYLSSYVGFPNRYQKQWKDRQYVIQGGTYGTGTVESIVNAISLSLGHWISMIVGICIFIALIIALIVIYRKQICREFIPYHNERCQLKKQAQKLQQYDIEQNQEIKQENIENQDIKFNELIDQQVNQDALKQTTLQEQINQQNHKTINRAIIVFEVIGTIITIIMITLFCCQPYEENLHMYVPAYYIMIKSFGKRYYKQDNINLGVREYQQILQQHNQFQISEDYPLVHGNLYQWCSWNKQECEEQYHFNSSESQQYTPQNLIDPPNLVNIFYESWTPSPVYIKKEFYNADTADGWIDGQPYEEDTFKNLTKLSQNAVNFLSLSTNALPTIHAWQSLITSEKVSLSSYNVVKSLYHQVESQNEILKQKYNFHSSYVSPAPGDFDGKNYWYGRPQLYDAVYYQAPTDAQLSDYNIPENPKNAWVDDMITTREAMMAFGVNLITSGKQSLETVSEAYCKHCGFPIETDCSQIVQQHVQALQQSFDNIEALPGQPLMLQMLTVNTHTPWKGYFSKNSGIYNYSIKDDYERQLQYSQEQISNLMEFILELAPNTIFTIHGDHGNRISAQDRLGDLFDDRCKNGVTGNDEMFDVSGILGWGTDVDTEVTQYLQQYVNKTYTKMMDFDDLTNLLYKIYDVELPTSRNSYFSKSDIFNNEWLKMCQNKISSSATHTIIEVRENNTIFRGNLFSSDNGFYIQDLQYPTCTVTSSNDDTTGTKGSIRTSNIVNNKQLAEKLYNRGKRQISIQNYYTDKNMLWNEQFSNENCWFDPINNKGQFCQLQ